MEKPIGQALLDVWTMKLAPNQKLVTDPKTGKQRIVEIENPKLNTSAKIQQRKSKRQKVVSKAKAGRT